MKDNELLHLHKTLEEALRIVRGEIRNARPVNAGYDSKGFVKPPSTNTLRESVEDALREIWDELPSDFFSAEEARTLMGKLKPGKIARRSHASYSAALSRWAQMDCLEVKQAAGPTPYKYRKRKAAVDAVES